MVISSMVSLTVVTICYNCRDEIPDTVESVLKQTYDDLEYIVVDGNSTDGTSEWLSNRTDEFDIFISEPDNGRYDAMNKGLELASGDYVLFLHAGDSFREVTTVEDVLSDPVIDDERPLIISGRMELMLDGEPMGLQRPWKAGKEGPGLPHPATLIDREFHQSHPYDEQFAYCGDYELWARLRDEGLFDVYYVEDVISEFNVSGVSNSPDVAYARYLERTYVDYLYSDNFGAVDAATLLVVPLVRRILRSLLGHRRFVGFLRYRRWLKRQFGDQP